MNKKQIYFQIFSNQYSCAYEDSDGDNIAKFIKGIEFYINNPSQANLRIEGMHSNTNVVIKAALNSFIDVMHNASAQNSMMKSSIDDLHAEIDDINKILNIKSQDDDVIV